MTDWSKTIQRLISLSGFFNPTFSGEDIWYLLYHIPLANFSLPRKLPGKNTIFCFIFTFLEEFLENLNKFRDFFGLHLVFSLIPLVYLLWQILTVTEWTTWCLLAQLPSQGKCLTNAHIQEQTSSWSQGKPEPLSGDLIWYKRLGQSGAL